MFLKALKNIGIRLKEFFTGEFQTFEVGDRVRATRDYHNFVLDTSVFSPLFTLLDTTVEGTVREVKEYELRVQTDEGDLFWCLRGGAVLLEKAKAPADAQSTEEGKFKPFDAVATQTASRWQSVERGTDYPIGYGDTSVEATQNLLIRKPIEELRGRPVVIEERFLPF